MLRSLCVGEGARSRQAGGGTGKVVEEEEQEEEEEEEEEDAQSMPGSHSQSVYSVPRSWRDR